MTKIISIAIQKGGCGKTTSTSALAEALASLGHSVLAIDFDPQCSLSKIYDINSEGNSIAEVIEGTKELKDVVAETETGFFIAPSDIRLAFTETLIPGMMAADFKLKKILAKVTGADYILIDCPPSLGKLTINALTASDYVLTPIQPAIIDLRGLLLFLDTIKLVQENTNADLESAGIFATMVNNRLIHHKDAIAEIKRSGLNLLSPMVTRGVAVAEASADHGSIVTYRPNSKQAKAYIEIAKHLEALS